MREGSGGDETGAKTRSVRTEPTLETCANQVNSAGICGVHPREYMRMPKFVLGKGTVAERERSWVVRQEVYDNGEGVEFSQKFLPVEVPEAALVVLAVEEDVVACVRPVA